ncbi:hypothetical protein [uncultured Cohaesibacter sp.]|uniref:hypothetical protein n=1 Tax=uncultured Cohaesibacter sp. TaxID=1002546 RepID=UPI0029C86EFB|nr:hypothetical protein [uncultured Cohaesibacter sp.]
MRGLLHHFYSSRSLVGLAMLTGLVLTLWPISTCKATDVPLLVAVAPISPLPAPEKPRLSPSEEAMHGRPLPDGGVARLMGGDIVEAWLSIADPPL